MVVVLGGAGVPLQLVDRAAGWDVDRLEADVEARLAKHAPTEVAGPH